MFTDVEIYKSIQTLDHLKSKENELVQIWANMAFTRSTFRKYPSQVQEDVCDKGFPSCPDYNSMFFYIVLFWYRNKLPIGKNLTLKVILSTWITFELCQHVEFITPIPILKTKLTKFKQADTYSLRKSHNISLSWGTHLTPQV